MPHLHSMRELTTNVKITSLSLLFPSALGVLGSHLVVVMRSQSLGKEIALKLSPYLCSRNSIPPHPLLLQLYDAEA